VDPARNTLRDPRKAEQIVGEIPVQVGDRGTCHVAVDLRGLFHARDVQHLEVGVRKARHGPLHQQIGEVGHGIAERRQLPVQHRLHPRLGGMEDHVVEAVVAMDDRNALLLRNGFRQPLRQLFEFGNVLRLGRAVLLGPAIDLPRKIIAGFAEIAETDRLRIISMQLGERLDLAGEDFPPRFAGLARQRRIPEHPALFHRHDVEGGADHAVVGAQRVSLRDRKTLLAQCGDHLEFAIDRVRRGQ